MNPKPPTSEEARVLNPGNMHCTDKKFYGSAVEAARVAKRRMHQGVAYLRVYHCPDCRGFHLTSQKPNSAA